MNLERASRWIEIVANLGVIVTLLLLVAEVRAGTLAQTRQSYLDRSNAMNAPFFGDGPLPSILAAIKEVDGWAASPAEEALATQYDLSIEDAIVWARHLSMVLGSLDADYQVEGATQALTNRVRILLASPDIQTMWRYNRSLFSEAFQAFVEQIRASLEPVASPTSR